MELLAADGIAVRVVSMPCMSVFDRQPRDYRDSVLPPAVDLYAHFGLTAASIAAALRSTFTA